MTTCKFITSLLSLNTILVRFSNNKFWDLQIMFCILSRVFWATFIGLLILQQTCAIKLSVFEKYKRIRRGLRVSNQKYSKTKNEICRHCKHVPSFSAGRCTFQLERNLCHIDIYLYQYMYNTEGAPYSCEKRKTFLSPRLNFHLSYCVFLRMP